MKFIGYVLFFLVSAICWGQIEHPKASPYSIIEQQIGLSKISVSYSRPAAKGRILFGNRSNGEPGLVPYGRIWRVGANESTKITFDTDVSILNNKLNKGTYALYAFPNEEAWEIVFHNNLSHWGDGRNNYDSSEDALRINVKPIKTMSFQENFLISFDSITHNGSQLHLTWGNTKVKFPIKVNTTAIMESQIQEKLANKPTGQTYYEIARYYQEQQINLDLALGYVNKAIEINGSTYYFHRVKSLVLADLGDYSKAIIEAKKSRELAQKEGKDEFVRLNENNINRWENNN